MRLGTSTASIKFCRVANLARDWETLLKRTSSVARPRSGDLGYADLTRHSTVDRLLATGGCIHSRWSQASHPWPRWSLPLFDRTLFDNIRTSMAVP